VSLAVRAVHRISSRPPSLIDQFREVLGARDLFALLVGRELKIRYKQTALGAVWVILQPLVPAMIFTIVLGTFARLPSTGTPYLSFALAGLVLYGLFSSSASRAASAFVRDEALVTKVYVPRAVLPLAAGAASIVDFAVGAGLLLVLMLATGSLPPVAVVIAPAVAVAALALGLALGLALAGLSARYRDFLIAVPFVLQVLLYASPVIYSTELVPAELRSIYALNPITALIEAFRWALFGTSVLQPPQIVLGIAVGVIASVVALAVFKRSTRDLTDVL
jgi:lipopolysaccharide transport system permease protein